jgi:hypothetical protein
LNKNEQIAFSRSGRTAQFLSALNVTIVLKWISNHAPSHSFLTFATEGEVQRYVNRVLQVGAHSQIGGWFSYLLVVTLIGLFIFTCIRLLARTDVGAAILFPITGIVSLVALPMGWLYVAVATPRDSGLPNIPLFIAILEILVVMAGWFLFIGEKQSLPKSVSLLLLLLHFVFWGWLSIGGLYFWLDPLRLIYPAAGIAACLAWGTHLAHNKISVTTPVTHSS